MEPLKAGGSTKELSRESIWKKREDYWEKGITFLRKQNGDPHTHKKEILTYF